MAKRLVPDRGITMGLVLFEAEHPIKPELQ